MLDLVGEEIDKIVRVKKVQQYAVNPASPLQD